MRIAEAIARHEDGAERGEAVKALAAEPVVRKGKVAAPGTVARRHVVDDRIACDHRVRVTHRDILARTAEHDPQLDLPVGTRNLRRDDDQFARSDDALDRLEENIGFAVGLGRQLGLHFLGMFDEVRRGGKDTARLERGGEPGWLHRARDAVERAREREQRIAPGIPIADDRRHVASSGGKAMRGGGIVEVVKGVADLNHRTRAIGSGAGGKGEPGHGMIFLSSGMGKRGRGAAERHGAPDLRERGAAIQYAVRMGWADRVAGAGHRILSERPREHPHCDDGQEQPEHQAQLALRQRVRDAGAPRRGEIGHRRDDREAD